MSIERVAPERITVSTSEDALRITQTGRGNAFVVEDSENPDSTPFVIDRHGVVTATGINSGYETQLTKGTTTTLTVESKQNQFFTGSITETVVLPVASTLNVGHYFIIHNNSTGTVTVQSSGLNTILAMPGGTSAQFTCIVSGGTSATSWAGEYIGNNAVTGTGSFVLSNSATLTGTPVAPTASAGTDTTQIATTEFVTGAIADLAGTAPDLLNTLDELAQALGDDENFATTVFDAIDLKVAKAGDSMTGPLDILTSSTSAALRVTQTGTGVALLVEDSARNDSTPFTVLADGKVVLGRTSSVESAMFTVQAPSVLDTVPSSEKFISFYHTVGNNTYLNFEVDRHTAGSDWEGVQYKIQHKVDGTEMGYIAFNSLSTSRNVAIGTNGTDRIVVEQGGDVGIGTTNPAQKLDVAGNIRTTNQFISTLATGTAPLSVASTTLVSNLNADLLDGQEGSYYLNTSSTGQTKTGGLIAGSLRSDRIGNASGTELVIFGGDSVAQDLDSLGSEVIHMVSEGGVTIRSSSDNWTTPMATQANICYINNTAGDSGFPNNVDVGNDLTVGNDIDAAGDIFLDGKIRFDGINGWGSGSDIDGLLPGSVSGGLIQGPLSHHLVVGLRENDSSEVFAIVSGGGNYGDDSTYDTVIAAFRANGNVGIGVAQPSFKLEVDGSFAATTKSFDIEHPTKEGQRLQHGSLEGPENGVYVRGKGAVGSPVELPDYWTGLVDGDSITVQVTPIGTPATLYVADISDNTVTIGGGEEGTQFFYFIQAERKDVDKLVVEYAS